MTARELLAAHQAIIDAWFERWLDRQQKRIDEVFARREAKP